jgi:hypothetical protein
MEEKDEKPGIMNNAEPNFVGFGDGKGKRRTLVNLVWQWQLFISSIATRVKD